MRSRAAGELAVQRVRRSYSIEYVFLRIRIAVKKLENKIFLRNIFITTLCFMYFSATVVCRVDKNVLDNILDH